MIVLGEGPAPARVMIVGEAPGEQEERSGRPFAGKAGKELGRGLTLAGLTRAEVYITNVCKERPKNNKTPIDEMLAHWRPALDEELATVQPEALVLAGGVAARTFGLTLGMEALHGIPRRLGVGHHGDATSSSPVLGVATLFPVYHPAAPLHDTTLQTAFTRDWTGLRRLLAGSLPPWQEAPPPAVTLATEADLANLAGLPLIAVDTEGSIAHPWGLSYAVTPERGYVIPAGSPLLPLFHEAIQDKTVVLHYALHDLPVLAKLGVRPAAVRDTLRLARAVSETGGLKPLAYRLLGRVLSEYSAVAGPLEDQHYRQSAAAAADALGAPQKAQKARAGAKGGGAATPLAPPSPSSPQKAHAALWRGYMGIVASPAPKKAWQARKYLPPAPPWTPPLEGPFLQYAGEDACATIGILPVLHRLTENQREYEQLDRDILPMLARMQEVGLPVDRGYLEDLIPVLEANKETLRQEMIALTGMGQDFNPASGPQVKAVLFGLMGLEPKKFSKLTGSPTADEKFLRPLKHPFPRLLLQYRELDKQQGTYAEPWLSFLSPDGYMRARLDIGAKTGRMTASDPNVLAIPKHGDMGKVFRRAIRTARPGCVIASWDLSQIELRVLAEMSQDPQLKRAFVEGIDIHSLTASRIWRLPIDKLQPQHRLPAKTTNFGIVMGIAAQGLLDQMDANGISGWDVDSCDRMIKDWLAAYPRAAEWFLLNQAEARDRGYVTGWGGKVFWLGGIWSTDKRVVSEAERQATALKVQGGAQYLIKRAMRRYWQDFHAPLAAQGHIECLLQIHDELVFEMDEALIPAADAALQECLCRTTPLSVPVESKGAYGRVWEGADWREL